MTGAIAVASDNEEDPPAIRVRVSFDLLTQALGLPADHQVIGFFPTPAAAAGEAGSFEVVICGPCLPPTDPGKPLPLFEMHYKTEEFPPSIDFVEVTTQ
jgi:hypothetical protein